MERYSELFEIEYSESYSWYNGLVAMDSPLFIDPLLLKKCSEEEFFGSYTKVVDFFINAIIKIKDKRISKTIKKSMLCFGEKKELSLGYSFATNEGAGVNYKIASQMLEELDSLIQDGIIEKNNFEVVQLFNNNIDYDRMTDIISNILEYEIAKYTNRICSQLSIKMKTFAIRKQFDFETMSWEYTNIDLPFHNMKREEEFILLIPKEVLVTEMNCSKERFIKYIRTYHSPYMIETFGYNLKTEIEKNYNIIIKKIIENDKESIIEGFIENYTSNTSEYNLYEDKKGIINWYKSPKDFVFDNKNDDINDISTFADEMINITKNIIENNGGYKNIINNKNNLKQEPQIGLYILNIFIAFTFGSGYKIVAEPNHGTGALDFLLTNGITDVCIELKKSGHKKVLETIKKDRQLHQYMKDHNTKLGKYIVIYRNEDIAQKIAKIELNKKELEKIGYEIKCYYIDATDKPSASNL